jgi:hypothetical protein
MGNGTSKGKFNGLTTAGGGLLFDAGALSRNTGSLNRDIGAPGGNPDALSSDPDTLSCDPDALSCDPDALRFDPDALRFDVFHQGRGSNCLIASHLRGIASKPSKFGSFLLPRHYQWKGILPAFLINTVALARWLYGATVSSRFNGFFPSVSFPRIKAVETAAIQPGTHHTPLKQGVNEKAIHSKPLKSAFSEHSTFNIELNLRLIQPQHPRPRATGRVARRTMLGDDGNQIGGARASRLRVRASRPNHWLTIQFGNGVSGATPKTATVTVALPFQT